MHAQSIRDEHELRPGEAEMVALSDVELVRRAYALVGDLQDLADDDDRADAVAASCQLYSVLTEAFERWAPDAELLDRVESAAQEPTAKLREIELESSLTAMRRRAAARLTPWAFEDRRRSSEQERSLNHV